MAQGRSGGKKQALAPGARKRPAAASRPRSKAVKTKPKAKTTAGTWCLLYHAGPFKGRAEFMRLLFEDAGVTYKESADKLYGPEGFCDAFRGIGSSEKGLGAGAQEHVAKDTAPFPVMFPPILRYTSCASREAEVFVNQVPAIMRFCAAKLGYLPQSPAATAQADEIMLNANDFVAEGRACFHPVDNKAGYKEQKKEADKTSKKFAQERLVVWLGHFEKVVKKLRPGGNGPLFGKMTYADFMLFHALDAAEAQFNSRFYGKAWDSAAVPTLKKWKAWVASRPKLAKYLQSDRRKPWAGDSMM